MKKRKLCILATTLLLVAVLSIGATAAYSTDSEVSENNFSFLYADIELQEPEWEALSDPEKIAYPGRIIPKDPLAVNSGDVPLYVFIVLQVPKVTCRTVGADRVTIYDAATQPLFSFSHTECWHLVDTDNSAEDFETFVYGYCDVVEPGESTTKLFTSVNVIDFLEGDVDAETLQMPIRTFGIQSNYLEADDSSIEAQLEDIFTTHKNVLQN